MAPAAGCGSGRPTRSRKRIADITATVVLFVITAAVVIVAVGWMLFTAVIADLCGVDCSSVKSQSGYLVAAAGILVGVVGSIISTVTACKNQRVMFVWPLVGTALIIATAILGGILVMSRG